MKARSARFDEVMRSPVHLLSVRVDVLYNRQRITLPNRDTDRGLYLESGNVELDRRRAQMGSLQAVLAEPELVPLPTNPGVLTPFGYELQPWRGVKFSDGSVERLSLGVFPIIRSRFPTDELRGTIDARDRSELVMDARLEDGWTVAAGTPTPDAIRALITDGVPGLEYLFAQVSHTMPATVLLPGADRWAAARDWATAAGCELYFDGLGRCLLKPEVPLTNAVPVWEFVEGPNGLLIGADVEYDRQDAWSAVVASGGNSAVGVFTAKVVDSNPQSPTNYYGGFGKKPYFYSSPVLNSQAACLQAATTILAAKSGVARAVHFAGVPHPALEPGDVIKVLRAPMVAELYAFDSIKFGLTAADDGADIE